MQVIWGCGMPPQPMVKTSRPPLGITHAPTACW
ncbi:hypothetical protein [Pseudomonas sp. FH1]